MRIWYRPVGLLIGVSFLWGLAGCSQAVDTQPQDTPLASRSLYPSSALYQDGTLGEARSSSGGDVTIDVRWSRAGDGYLVFEVGMNTHSVDLDGHDLSALAILRDDSGAQYRAASWQSPTGGHHRKGTLIFPIPDAMASGEARYIELIISNIGGVQERGLQWEL